MVEECSSDGKESGSSEEDDQVSGHVGLRNAVACHLIGHQLKRQLVNLTFMVVKMFFYKTAKNVGVNIVSQSKDNHETTMSWRKYFDHGVNLLVTL